MSGRKQPSPSQKDKAMASNSKNSVMVRIPKHLKARLDELIKQVNETYESGRGCQDMPLTDQGAKGSWIPLWAVIEKGLDMIEDHKARSKKSAAKRAAKA